MRLIACLILAATLPLATVTGVHAQERFKVVTTFTVIGDMARNVAGEAASVESITPGERPRSTTISRRRATSCAPRMPT